LTFIPSVVLTYGLKVHTNESLLEAFLKGRWDPFVWTNVSLGYFTPVNTNFLWLDQPSIQGRFQLADALGNLALSQSILTLSSQEFLRS
jgi:hypothetical protein